LKKTAINMMMGFIGESQARNRYTLYAKKAKKEGYVLISNIFMETAAQELEHGSYFFKTLQKLKDDDSDLDIDTKGNITVLGNTIENLKASIRGENHEWEELYPSWADTADEEGLPDIAERLRAIARAEQHHSERYGKLLKLVGDDAFFKRGEKVVWVCLECGYEVEMDELPEDWECPSCHHPRSHFRKKCEDF
jgi:rubrerythrin